MASQSIFVMSFLFIKSGMFFDDVPDALRSRKIVPEVARVHQDGHFKRGDCLVHRVHRGRVNLKLLEIGMKFYTP